MTKQLRQFMRLLEHFQSVDPRMPPHSMLAFISVAMDPGISVSDLRHRLAINSRTAARAIASLRSDDTMGTSRLGLIRSERDAKDHRVKRLYLSKDGQALWRSIEEILH